jgi:hypothetical protein
MEIIAMLINQSFTLPIRFALMLQLRFFIVKIFIAYSI